MKEILQESETLFKGIEKLIKFYSKYQMFIPKEVNSIVEDIYQCMSTIPDIKEPKNMEELIQSELKRRLEGEAKNLEQRISSKHYDFDTIISMHGIPVEDIMALKPWLLANKESTMESVERLYNQKEIASYDLGLSADIPSIVRQAEGFSLSHIEKYYKKIGKLLEELTSVGSFLRDITIVPTNKARSYFDFLTKTLAIGIPAVCYAKEDRSLNIKEGELIRLFGHEGMGHALNYLISESSKLPYFLTKSSALITSTIESVAQFYENQIFEDIKSHPEVQKELGIYHNFNEIYQEAKDTFKLNTYTNMLFRYATIVLADKTLGEVRSSNTLKKKMEILSEFALDPFFPINFIESNKYNFDSQENLGYDLVSELRYCAKPVERALNEFEKQGIRYDEKGRSIIDATLLKGFWTPIGFVENAKIQAKNNSTK